nr:unnamed protein product [Callosobruchus chinensis]
MAAQKKRTLKAFVGVLIGILVSNLLSNSHFCRSGAERGASRPMQLLDEENRRAFNKNLLFVGVITAARYLDTRAKSVYDTWGSEISGKVTFFSSEGSNSGYVPLVALPFVDDSYPPQRKSFMMLKYMHDHYVDHYEWFIRADDDVYMRTDKLEELLRSVDSRKPWFIGQTGRGNTEEFGQLSLDSDENFCMGGPGVILSRETLKRVAPHLDHCLQELYTTHEDVELGRCVRKYAGISCTWSYEMQVIFYHNQSGESAFSNDLKQKEVHRAITLHPVKKDQLMYRLHKYIKGLNIQNLQQSSLLLHRDIAASMDELGHQVGGLSQVKLSQSLPLFPAKRGAQGYLGETSLLGVPTKLNRYTPHTLENVLEWEIVSKTLYSHKDLNPRRRIGSSLKEGLGDVTREIMELINSYSKQRGRVIEFKDIFYGYYRVNPIHGVDLILDMLLVYRKYRGHKLTVQVRRHAYVQQTYTGTFVREIHNSRHLSNHHYSSTEPEPIHRHIINQIFSKLSVKLPPLSKSSTNNKTNINFILPVSGRYEIFKRFLKHYEQQCILQGENTSLYIILYKNESSPEDFSNSLKLVKDLIFRYQQGGVRVVTSNDTFTRGRALQIGVELLQNEDLMLFIDVDMIFDRSSLERIRKNTVIKRKVYFPIVYSLYNPKFLNEYINVSGISQGIIDETHGFWRQFGFGIGSLYKSDYIDLGGFNLMISGWGYEDVTFYDNVVKSGLKIVRAVDPGLIHVYHNVQCDEHLEVGQKAMCLGSMADTMGALRTLQELFLKYKTLFR